MIITQTPLRIGLVGGGTDLPAYADEHGGVTLSAAIDKYIYVIVRQRFDDDIHLSYSRRESVSRVEDIEHELIREAMLLTGVTSGVDIVTLADIPSEGSGLGSSSTVTVGLLNALHTYAGRQVSLVTLAAQACHIEIERCGKPIGRQDQYAAALGGIRALRFGPGGSVTAEPVGLGVREYRDLQRQTMLFHTGMSRQRRADDILADQAARIESTRPQFDKLRDLAEFTIQKLEKGETDVVGLALRENWELKRSLGGGVSGSGIESAVRRALDAGASGAKICGAGGGGFLVVIAAPDHQADVAESLAPMRQLPVRFDRYGTRVVLNIAGDLWS